ncbi:MAG: ATP-binding protein [Nitrospirota bacterium]
MAERLNPYNCNNPAPPEEFAGREDVVRQIKEYIESSKEGNPHNVAIIGEWAIGKTSLIDFLTPYALSNNCLIVTVEGSEGAISDTASLYERILESIRTTTLSYCGYTSRIETSFKPTIGFGSPPPDKSPKLIQFFADDFDIDIRAAIIHGEAGT